MLGRGVIFHPCGWYIKELAGGSEAVKKSGQTARACRHNLLESDLEIALKHGSVP